MDTADTTEIGAFTAAVASDSVTPSGGACAAVAAAMGAALCEMGCRHAPGGEDDHRERRTALAARRDRLLGLADEDAAVVDALLAARRGDDPDAVAAARRRATEVPLEIAQESLAVLEAAVEVLDSGSFPAAMDVRTGVFLAHAAVRAAVETARTNLEPIADADYVAEVETTAAEVTADAEAVLARVTNDPHDW